MALKSLLFFRFDILNLKLFEFQRLQVMEKLYNNMANKTALLGLVAKFAGRGYQVFRINRGGGRGGGQSRKSKVRSENSKLDFRASEVDI